MCYYKKCRSKDVIKAEFVKIKIADLSMLLSDKFYVNEDFHAIMLFSQHLQNYL